MITKKIESLQHPFVKYLVKIRTDKNFRIQEQRVLVSGKKMVQELSSLRYLFTTQEDKKLPQAEETILVTPPILKKITGLENPESFAALVPLPSPSHLEGKRYLLALDGIADPGNLGTLLRTALAMGWEGVFLTEGSADPFNDKALRAAKGATFRIPLRTGRWEELEALIAKNNMQVLLADIQGERLQEHNSTPPLLLVLGHEAHGVSPLAKKRFPRIAVPMSGQMESLNVAGAGAILMHTLRSL